MPLRKQNISERRFLPTAYRLLPTVLCLLLIGLSAGITPAQTAPPATAAPDFQSVIARQASLVTEFEVNGLKVLMKRRDGSQTVSAGLFIRGGVENIAEPLDGDLNLLQFLPKLRQAQNGLRHLSGDHVERDEFSH